MHSYFVKMRQRFKTNQPDSSEEEHGEENVEKRVNKFPTAVAVLFFGAVIILFISVHYIDESLPRQLDTSEEDKFPGRFIGKRSQNLLSQLAGIGPKVTGSKENEELAVEFLKREINSVKQQAHSVHDIQLDVQLVSGEYYLDFNPYGLTNMYRNVQNVVARISNSEQSSNSSLLLNCHFDSVPVSPGASDDGINCVTMLEVLRVLSKSSVPLKHNVIFLFNGAEENPLQAAHGFITKHKWRKEVKAVINLEAAGAGGREVLFQAGPGHPWLMNYYASVVPHPHAQVVAEELFQNNIIPSDTDFRLFRDFGKIPGVDIAFGRNGYVYHTRYDSVENIPPGTYQHVGDNILALVKSIASSPELENTAPHAEGRLVFFDVFGFFMIVYKTLTACILNCITILLAIYLCFRFIRIHAHGKMLNFFIKHFLVSLGAQVLGWITGMILCILIALLIDSVDHSMSWYARPWLVIGLYFAPTLAGSMLFLILLHEYRNKKKNYMNLNSQVQLHLHTAIIPWIFLLLITTIVGLRLGYLFMLSIIFPVTACFIITLSSLQYNSKAWISIFISLLVFPTMFFMYQVKLLLAALIPIMGRAGGNKNAELSVGLLSSSNCILIMSIYVPLVLFLKSPRRVLYGLLCVTGVTLLAVLFTGLGFPYSGNPSSLAPQRYWIFHSERTFYDFSGNVRKKDAGYFFLNLDRNSPKILNKYIPELQKKAANVASDCETELFCGLPLYTSRMLEVSKESTWIPAPPPIISQPTNLKITARNMVKTNTRRYSFTLDGPDHMGIYISPKNNVTLVNWSLLHNIPRSGPLWMGRPTYFILYGYGTKSETLEFSIDLETPMGWPEQPVVDIAITGQYNHEDKSRTAEFQQFLNKFPSWTHVTAWMSTYKSFTY